MRSLYSAARSFVMFGLGLFACAVLAFPTAALADTIEVRLDGYRLRLFENTSIYQSGFTQLNQSGTVAKYFTKYIYDDDSMTGLIDPNYSYTDPSISRVYDYSVSLNDPNAYGYEVYRSETFPTSSGSVDNSFIGLLVDLGGTVISRYQTLRVMLPSNGFQLEAQNSTTSSTRYNVTFSVAGVYTGTNQNSLYRATSISGAWQVQTNSSMVLIVFSSSGRGASYLDGAHSYIMYGCPRLFLNVPSADASEINAQSVTNTNLINNNITTQTTNQTNALKDTTGSGTVASGAVDQYKQTYENNGVVTKIGPIQETLKDAVFANEVQNVVAFPGLNLMGFEIQAQDVSIPANVLGLLSTIRFMTTLLFVGYFLRYLYGWVNAIWGLSDVERQVDYEWIVEEENLSTGVRSKPIYRG